MLTMDNCGITSFQENNLGCPYIELPDSMDEYLAKFKGKRRRALKNLRKQLFEKHQVEVIQWDNYYDINMGIQMLFDLHKARFGDHSVFHSNINNAFIKEILYYFFKNDTLKLYFMKINGEFACVMCCFKFKNVLLYYQTGYDPKWINISALRILIYEVIESAIKNQTQIFDL